jgi:integrase
MDSPTQRVSLVTRDGQADLSKESPRLTLCGFSFRCGSRDRKVGRGRPDSGRLNWHSLRRTHATLFQFAGGSLRDAQAQLGHSKMSTTLEIYTLPMPDEQRATIEKLSVLMANDGRKDQNPEGLPLASEQIQ